MKLNLLRTTAAALLFAASLAMAAIGQKPSPSPSPAPPSLSVCRDVDETWKCLDESREWKAGAIFNVLFDYGKPVGVDFIGIVIYKQGAGGKDAEFIREAQHDMGARYRKYATGGASFRLPAGVYSIYVIPWEKREIGERKGNLKDYLAKTTLTVK